MRLINLYNKLYREIYFIYNRNRLNPLIQIPRENEAFNYTIFDYIVMIYMFTFISGGTALLLGKEHWTVFLSCFMALSIFIFFGTNLYKDFVNDLY